MSKTDSLSLIHQKQLPEVFYKKKAFLEISRNSQENTSARVSVLIGLRPATLLKKRLWQRCFPVNFAKFLRKRFLQNTSGWLLLIHWFFYIFLEKLREKGSSIIPSVSLQMLVSMLLPFECLTHFSFLTFLDIKLVFVVKWIFQPFNVLKLSMVSLQYSSNLFKVFFFKVSKVF